MSQSLSVKSLTELHPDEPIIDLDDSSVVLQFACCIRNLSDTRRQSIWAQNVSLNGVVQSQTRLRQQVDDILLFLIIIFGKEQYPDEEERLISKLKVFVASAPFINLKQYIEQKCFPLSEQEFIHNADYFANMIEEYARSQLMFRVNSFRSESSSPSSLSSMDSVYSKLEEKMIDLFASKFGELEFRINNIEKEVYSIKNILKNEAVSTAQGSSDTHREFVSTDTIMEEIQNIKKEMCKINKGTNKKKGKKNNEKARTLSRITPKQKSVDSARKTLKKKQKKKLKAKSVNSAKKGAKSKISKSNKSKQTKEELQKKEEFKVWLRDECELSEYLNVFIENKLDNLCVVQCLKTSDLALLGITNNSDKIKIMQNVQKLKYERTADRDRSI